MPKISIIIPVYNVEKYLPKCLESVIKQTLTDIEIICVNDGSTDNSSNILSEYAKNDNRIKIINQNNMGVSEARNYGLKVAVGEFIAFLDSDDYLALDFCEKLYKRAIETDSDIVVCEYVYRFKNNKKKLFLKVDKNVITTNAKEKFECLYLPSFCYVWNKIYKRESLKENFLKDIKWEDVYFTCNVLYQSGKMSIASDTAYYYRDTDNSIVNEKSILNSYYYHKAFTYFYDFIIKNNINIDVNNYEGLKKYKIFGMTVLNIKRDMFVTKYNLLNQIRWTIPKSYKKKN